MGPRQVAQVAALIRAQQPDLLVATGDIVDGHIKHFDGVSQLLQGLNPPLGMVAVLGNHEYYAGVEPSYRFLEQSGFEVVRDRAVLKGDVLALAGVDDAVGRRFGNAAVTDEGDLLSGQPRERFVVLLKHRPVVERSSRGQFDLQLSGHVHKGQIFPFNLLTWLAFPVRAGMQQVEGGGKLYVNRGTGTWGPPVRFLAPPEITVFELVAAEN